MPRRLPLLTLGLVLGAVSLAAPAARGAASLGPSGVVKQTSERVLAVLRNGSLDEDQKRDQVVDIALEVFDFNIIPRLVLARHYRAFSPEQRAAFREEFQRFLVVSYGHRISRYSEESVEILGERPEPRGDVTVRTRIVGGQADGFNVDYRMRQRDGSWRMIDVVIEGVSAVSNYRSQFAEVLSRGTPEDLLERLREKNAAGPQPGDELPSIAPTAKSE